MKNTILSRCQTLIQLSIVLGLFLVLLPKSFAGSNLHFQAGINGLDISEEQVGQVPTLKIRIDHYNIFDRVDYQAWTKSRFTKDGDQNGLREYWLKDAQDYPENGMLIEAMKLYPQEFKSGIMEMSLSSDPRGSQQIEEWNKVLYTPSEKVYQILSAEIRKFLKKYEKTLSAALNKYSHSGETPKNLVGRPMTAGMYHSLTIMNNFFLNGKLTPQLIDDFLKNIIMKKETKIPKVRYQQEIANVETLIVTHATTVFDLSRSAKASIDAFIRPFKLAGRQVIFLVHPDGVEDSSWYTEDRTPSVALHSHGGEHSFLIANPHVVMTGGYLEECFRRSVQDSISRYFLTQAGPLNIHLPLDAIYSRQGLLSKFLQRSSVNKFKEYIKLNLINAMYGGLDQERDDNEQGGLLDLHSYRFDIFLDHQQIDSVGSGTRTVRLFFWNPQQTSWLQSLLK